MAKVTITKANWRNVEVSEKMMDHEYHRWSYMDYDALKRRLTKITNPVKLIAFYRVARLFEKFSLSKAARVKLEDLIPSA